MRLFRGFLGLGIAVIGILSIVAAVGHRLAGEEQLAHADEIEAAICIAAIYVGAVLAGGGKDQSK